MAIFNSYVKLPEGSATKGPAIRCHKPHKNSGWIEAVAQKVNPSMDEY